MVNIDEEEELYINEKFDEENKKDYGKDELIGIYQRSSTEIILQDRRGSFRYSLGINI